MSSSPNAQRFCARAPVRVDPAGAGTDCPPFSEEHGGVVVNFAIDRYVYATFERMPAGFGKAIYSRDMRDGVHVRSHAELPADGPFRFLAAFLKRMAPSEESCRLVTDSRIPESSGLGGSAAVGVAVTAAIDRAYGRVRDAQVIAEEANAVERVDLGMPGGSQDSYGAALGGFNRVEYHKGGGTSYRKINVPRETVLQLERESLLIYTGSAHVSGSIHDDIRTSYRLPQSTTLQAMFDLRAQAELMTERLEAGDLAGYAGAMQRCRFHHYGLHESCDSPRLRQCFKLLDPLILGGKACGAGGGGFILVCAQPDRYRECVAAVEGMAPLVWPVAVSSTGVESWTE